MRGCDRVPRPAPTEAVEFDLSNNIGNMLRACQQQHLEVLDAAEAAAADGSSGDDPEEDLDHVQPGSRGRGEAQGDRGLRANHAFTAGCLWVA
jgi:hypothetical protein